MAQATISILRQFHVVPALMRKAHEAKVSGSAINGGLGSGSPRREFLHVDDLADALVYLAKVYSGEGIVNIGSGEEVTIAELAELVASVVGFRGIDHFRSDQDRMAHRASCSIQAN